MSANKRALASMASLEAPGRQLFSEFIAKLLLRPEYPELQAYGLEVCRFLYEVGHRERVFFFPGIVEIYRNHVVAPAQFECRNGVVITGSAQNAGETQTKQSHT
jgi:hypothetical protein